ncbi:MAG: hypothetical protein WAK32_06950 [Xanthobacteraceae bacterium]
MNRTANQNVLKSQLVRLFKQNSRIQCAYLVQISSGDVSGVALCLKSKCGPDQNLVREIGAVFAGIFVRQEHLDILFLTEAQETALTTVCAPFYYYGDSASN